MSSLVNFTYIPRQVSKNYQPFYLCLFMDLLGYLNIYLFILFCEIQFIGSCMILALELRNIYSYTLVIELQELHMYTISHMVNCIPCNSFDLFNNIHTHKNVLNCNEMQMVIATQKPICKVSYKSPHFFIMWTKLQPIGVILGVRSL